MPANAQTQDYTQNAPIAGGVTPAPAATQEYTETAPTYSFTQRLYRGISILKYLYSKSFLLILNTSPLNTLQGFSAH